MTNAVEREGWGDEVAHKLGNEKHCLSVVLGKFVPRYVLRNPSKSFFFSFCLVLSFGFGTLRTVRWRAIPSHAANPKSTAQGYIPFTFVCVALALCPSDTPKHVCLLGPSD